MDRGRMQLLLQEAIRSAKSGNSSWARDCLTQIIQADPHHEQAWLWLSAVLETPAEKRYCLERVLSINPQNKKAEEGLRWLDKQEGVEREDTAPKRTLCPMCGEPNAPTAFRCVNCNQELFVRCPRCGERVDIDRSTCAHCKLEIGDSSDGPAYFFHLGELYLQQGKPKMALDTWDKTLLLKPDYPRVAEVAAEAFLANNQRDLAVQSMQRAIEEVADDPEKQRQLLLRLAAIHRELGQMDEAHKIYEDLLRQDKESKTPQADLYIEMGHFYQDRGDREASRYYYEMALALDEELHDVRFTLTRYLLDEGYELRALSELSRLQELPGEIGAQSKVLIEQMRPPVPEGFRNRWAETFRGIGRYFLAGVLLLIISVGQDWQLLNVWDLLALTAFLLGGYFLTAAVITPKNLPTFEHLADLAETPMMLRLRREGKTAGQSSSFQRFLSWQKKSARQLTSTLRIWQTRLARGLQQLAARLSQSWQKFKGSRLVLRIRALPQSRFFRAVAGLRQKAFFQWLGRTLQPVGRLLQRLLEPVVGRIMPRRGGESIFQQLRQAIGKGFRRLLERASQVELSEMQLYRMMAVLLGILLVLLGSGLILLF